MGFEFFLSVPILQRPSVTFLRQSFSSISERPRQANWRNAYPPPENPSVAIPSVRGSGCPTHPPTQPSLPPSSALIPPTHPSPLSVYIYPHPPTHPPRWGGSQEGGGGEGWVGGRDSSGWVITAQSATTLIWSKKKDIPKQNNHGGRHPTKNRFFVFKIYCEANPTQHSFIRSVGLVDKKKDHCHLVDSPIIIGDPGNTKKCINEPIRSLINQLMPWINR